MITADISVVILGRILKKHRAEGQKRRENREEAERKRGARGEEMHYGYDRKGSLPPPPDLPPPELPLANFLPTANKRNVPARNVCGGRFSVGSVPLIKTTSAGTAGTASPRLVSSRRGRDNVPRLLLITALASLRIATLLLAP